MLFSPDFKYKVDSFKLYITDNYVKRTVYHELKTLKTINKIH